MKGNSEMKWSQKSLHDLLKIHNGIDYKKNPPGDSIPIYGTGGIIGFTSISLNEGPAVLSGRKGSISRPFYVEGAFWNVDTIFCLKPFENLNAKYLYYSLLNIDLTVLNEATGVPSVTSKSLYKLKLSLPNDIDFQRHIATILSTCDEVIERTEEAIAKYRSIKAGMLHDLFTRGLDKNGKLRPSPGTAPERYKDSLLGLIPKEWEVKRLEECCSMKAGEGITSGRIFSYATYPVYGGNGLRGYTWSYTHDGIFVLIGRQGALCGNVNIASGQFYASEHAVVVNHNNDMDVFWLFHKLKDMNLNQYSEASAQPGLSVNKILRLKIHVPHDVEEQTAIASRLSGIDDKLRQEELVLSKYRSIKQGLMKKLLTPPEGVLAI